MPECCICQGLHSCLSMAHAPSSRLYAPTCPILISGVTLSDHACCLQGEIAHVEHANGKLPNGKGPALLDAPLEAEETVEEATSLDQGVATMMSRDARQLFLAGDPAAGLQAWRVRLSDVNTKCTGCENEEAMTRGATMMSHNARHSQLAGHNAARLEPGRRIWNSCTAVSPVQ